MIEGSFLCICPNYMQQKDYQFYTNFIKKDKFFEPMGISTKFQNIVLYSDIVILFYQPFLKFLSNNGKDMSSTFLQKVFIIV